jgi:hypothetical protein
VRFHEILVVLVGALSSAAALKALPAQGSPQNFYYVFDGQSLTLVQQDPTNVSAPKWAAFFFLKGRSTAISNRWGMSEKSTPADVMKSVESSQDFERSYEKWCGCDWGEETFFNEIAPVAMVDSGKVAVDPLKIQLLNKTNDTWDEAQELMEQYNQAAELSGGEPLPKITSGPIAEYLKNIHAVIDQYKSTYEKITQYSDSALQSLQNSVDAFAASVSRIEKTAPQTLQALKQKTVATAATLTSLQFNEPGENDSTSQYTWSIVGSKIIEDFTYEGTLTGHKEVPIQGLDLKDTKVYAGWNLTDNGFTLYLRCSTSKGTVVTPPCINGTESDWENGGVTSNTADIDIYIHCDTQAQCEAFRNSVAQAAR